LARRKRSSGKLQESPLITVTVRVRIGKLMTVIGKNTKIKTAKKGRRKVGSHAI